MQNVEQDANELLTTSDVAEALGIHVGTVARMVASGRLSAAVKAPGKRGAFLFTRADVEALAAERAGANA